MAESSLKTWLDALGGNYPPPYTPVPGFNLSRSQTQTNKGTKTLWSNDGVVLCGEYLVEGVEAPQEGNCFNLVSTYQQGVREGYFPAQLTPQTWDTIRLQIEKPSRSPQDVPIVQQSIATPATPTIFGYDPLSILLTLAGAGLAWKAMQPPDERPRKRRREDLRQRRSPSSSMPMQTPETEAVEAVEVFDWRELTHSPHIIIAGESGSGKTTLAKRILPYLSGKVAVCDPHGFEGKWGNTPIYGAHRNYQEIGDFLESVESIFNDRFSHLGKSEPPMLNIIIDEFPAVNSQLGCTDWLKRMLMEARKVNIRIVLLTQGVEVEALGIAGQGSLRDALFPISLGRLALRSSKSDKALYTALKQQPRPCIAGGKLAIIPGN